MTGFSGPRTKPGALALACGLLVLAATAPQAARIECTEQALHAAIGALDRVEHLEGETLRGVDVHPLRRRDESRTRSPDTDADRPPFGAIVVVDVGDHAAVDTPAEPCPRGAVGEPDPVARDRHARGHGIDQGPAGREVRDDALAQEGKLGRDHEEPARSAAMRGSNLSRSSGIPMAASSADRVNSVFPEVK